MTHVRFNKTESWITIGQSLYRVRSEPDASFSVKSFETDAEPVLVEMNNSLLQTFEAYGYDPLQFQLIDRATRIIYAPNTVTKKKRIISS